MDDRYIARCPVGCDTPLQPTRVRLPEGVLLRCPGCGQHVSQATVERYHASMREFDTGTGTDPVVDARSRRDAVARRRIARLARFAGHAPLALDLLDVGCSSGAFLSSAVAMGVPARGVEPAPQAAASARTRGLRWFERGEIADPLYRVAKLATEALSPLAAVLGRGQDMLAWLRRPAGEARPRRT